ncbi:MAG: hypothetical protein JWP12_1669 [Bacteroidetes bacterium]|nr:hypothetical protein [Bacteroidota bacterium]
MGKKKINPVLCDTNILFEFLNGDNTIKQNLEKIGEGRIAFSVITHAEAYCGSNKDEFVHLKAFFKDHKTFHISEESSEIFNGLIQSHYNQRHRNGYQML